MNLLRPLVRLFIPIILDETRLELRSIVRQELDYVNKMLSVIEKDFRGKVGHVTAENADLLRSEYEKVRQDFAERVAALTESAGDLENHLKETMGTITRENIDLIKAEYADLEQRLIILVKTIGSGTPQIDKLTKKVEQYGLSGEALRKLTRS